MALALVNSVGPGITAEGVPYTPVGISIATTPAAPFGGGWVQLTGTDAATGDFGETPRRSITPSSYGIYWACIRGFRLETTPGAGDNFGIIRIDSTTFNRGLRANGQAGGTYKLQFTTGATGVGDESTSSFSPNVTYTMRIQYDGTNHILWVDDVREIVFASTARPSSTDFTCGIGTLTPFSSARKWNMIAMFTSTDLADRPGISVEVVSLHPNANGNYGQAGDQTDCTASTTGDFARWDDWVAGGVNDGSTTFNCFEGTGTAGTNTRESSALTTATMGQTIIGAHWYGYCALGSTTKNLDSNALIRSGTTDIEKSLSVVNSTTFAIRNIIFPDVPGGGAWSQTIVDGLEAGYNKIGAALDANIHVTALMLEIVAVDSDAPRRALVSWAEFEVPNPPAVGGQPPNPYGLPGTRYHDYPSIYRWPPRAQSTIVVPSQQSALVWVPRRDDYHSPVHLK